jgi:hypothetical protein
MKAGVLLDASGLQPSSTDGASATAEQNAPD